MIKQYWDEPLPLTGYVDRKRDGLAMSVINNTIHNTLKDVTDEVENAYEAMSALQSHFRKGGRTAQFSLFNQLVDLRLDLSEVEMITHMARVDAIVFEMESTGFTWSSESIQGLFYQVAMPGEMTKEINKELDNKFDKSSPTFKLKDVKAAIQIYLAREKTASETITISSLNTQVEAMSVNTRNCHVYQNRNLSSTPTSTPTSSFQHGSFRRTQRIEPMRWKRGPLAWTDNDHN